MLDFISYFAQCLTLGHTILERWQKKSRDSKDMFLRFSFNSLGIVAIVNNFINIPIMKLFFWSKYGFQCDTKLIVHI